jgi:hypothetical protein
MAGSGAGESEPEETWHILYFVSEHGPFRRRWLKISLPLPFYYVGKPLIAPGKNATEADLQKFRKELDDANEGDLEDFARSYKAGKDKDTYIHMSDLASTEDDKGGGILQWVQLVMAGERCWQHLKWTYCAGDAVLTYYIVARPNRL